MYSTGCYENRFGGIFMLKKGLTLLVFLCLTVFLGAQPKVAVLDATLGQGVSVNASAIVADTINEQFVKAPNFTAIDRAYISSIQEEKKFQLSGDVTEEDIKEIGNTFGADYICVANVSILGTTYTVSARLIEVSTAQVYAQESHRMKGEIDILFMIAEIVGAQLVGSDMANIEIAPSDDITKETSPIIETAPEPEPETEPEPELVPAPQPTREKKEYAPGEPRGHFMVSFVFTGYLGAEDSYEDGYALYDVDSYYSDYYDITKLNYGIDVHYMEPFLGFIYYSLGFIYTTQILAFDDGSNLYQYEMFNSMEPYAGLGAVISPTNNLEFYGGVTGGIMILTLGDEYSSDATEPFWVNYGESAVGMSLGFEIGATLYGGPFGLDMRYKYAKAGNMTGDVLFPEAYTGDRSFGHQGLAIGIGFMF